ncbi:helix-turn-helix domain-containing protein [Companilactobacillus nodensis]|uniref:helix-turn-helix domain-containing protein n=1 Tax=Companilactobacillus nodensis TaxID=460870 RepID=UPI0009DF2C78|nr:helix-turn-helix transcriptional regulator [Companilactobacillus nodensis]
MLENNFSTILGSRLLRVTDVYKATGISRSTLTNLYYRRTKTIRISTLTKICDYLDIPLSSLIEYYPESHFKKEDTIQWTSSNRNQS